jgi:putative protease
MTLYRNRDHAFLRLLEKPSAERRIAVDMRFFDTPHGFTLMLTDEDGCVGMAELMLDKQAAQNAERAESSLREGLAKLGNTDFVVGEITLDWSKPWFIPASGINALRRAAIDNLQSARATARQRPARREPVEPPVAYPEDTLSYLANVYNHKARAFYEKHGVKAIAAAYEANEELGEVSLMITKHCLRYSYAMCPREAKGVIGVQGTITAEPMTLVNGKERLTLRFDCKKCEMHVMGKIRKPVLQMPQPVQFYAQRPEI